MRTFHVTKFLCYLGGKVEFTEVIQMSQIFKTQNGEWHIQDKFIPLNFFKKVESTIK